MDYNKLNELKAKYGDYEEVFKSGDYDKAADILKAVLDVIEDEYKGVRKAGMIDKDLVDYLCYCSQNNISLSISPEDEEKLYATLIDVCYENMSYDRQVDFWRHVLETNSLVCEVKE